MKKWRGSLRAKVGAWIGITLSGVVFLASAVAAFAIWDAGFYEYASEDACRKALYKDAANHYAVRALDNLGVQMENKWYDTSFRYGIIKADNIDNIDFNNKDIYIESNFTEEVEADDLYKLSYEIGEDTYFSYSGTLFGSYAVVEGADSYVSKEPVYKVIYNTEDGIFYHETSSEFFPVREVKLGYLADDWMEIYTFAYDFETKMYYNQETNVVEKDTNAESESVEVTASAPGIDVNDETTYVIESAGEGDFLEQEYLTFAMLEEEDWTHEDWNYIILDGKQYMNDGSDIWWVENGFMQGKSVSEETDYEVVEAEVVMAESVDQAESASNYDRWIRVTHDASLDRETYWVVVDMPEEVELGWNADMFVQANTLATLGYGLRNGIYVILFVSLGLALMFFVFLVSAAGHRNDVDGIVMTWFDRMPLDIYSGFALIICYILLLILAKSSYYLNQIPGMMMFCFTLICICWLLLLSILTLAVRIKCGKWWHNTVIWQVISRIFGVWKEISRHISLLWKVIVVIGALSLVEFWVVSWDGIGRITVFWFVEKLVLIPCILLAMIQMHKLKCGAAQMAEGDLEHRIDTEKMFWEFKEHGETLNSISSGMSRAVDERMKSERFKTELITNVSHDIKTPLTSIINYVDLLEKEELDNCKAEEYLEVLKRQSARLKKLIEDLMEASKASTGNLAVNMEELEAGVTLVQIVGEFQEKIAANELELVIRKPEKPIYILADGRHFWRVVDNLMNNICKYAQAGTRVYINLEETTDKAVLTFRNTSKYQLNISSEALMERFVRGDSSRNTEGSGLGLSIARSLMELMGGSFYLHIDGDLFKVELIFRKMAK